MANKWDATEEGKAWHKEYRAGYPVTTLRLRKDSGIPAALEKVATDAGIPAIEYLRLAVAERLQAEGYDPGYKASK